MKRILVVDDDIQINSMLTEVLSRKGYGILNAYSGTEALLLLEKIRPDLILLDLMLPGLSGEELLPKIKGVPVIVVSAKMDVTDKVKLLTEGAVDYITKPFDIGELLARIEVQLRRVNQGVAMENYSYGNVFMDTASRLVKVSGKDVQLTKTEYAILKLLIQSPDHVITKSAILDKISYDTPDCTESSLKTHMSHLRSKLRNADDVEHIESVWGIGFKMAKADETKEKP